MIWYIILIAACTAVDWLIKLWALRVLQPVGTIEFIPGLLKWTYVENRGAAFGIFEGQRWILSLLSIAIVCACVWCIAKKMFETKLENTCVALIAAGGLGNVIDRVSRGFVVDYIDINDLFSYPMFNFADCCVVVGALLFAAYVIFGDIVKKKEQETAAKEQNAEETAE